MTIGVLTMTEEYLTVRQVAKRLQVTRQAVYNWINEGRLQAVKAGRATRIPVSALNTFLKPYEQSEKDEDKK